MNDWNELIKEAEMVAIKAHKDHSYDIWPYEKHLRDVVKILTQFGYTNEYIIAGWLHDVIEDANISYSKIKNAFGEKVAEMVRAVTDRNDLVNRKEKKEWTYQKLQKSPDGLIIKLADRIANVKHGVRMKNHEKTKMYQKEHSEFRSKCKIEGHADAMWEYLEGCLMIDSTVK